MGTETDWLSNGQYTPSSHGQMSLWRTLSGKKPYLLLMNTDYASFGTNRGRKVFSAQPLLWHVPVDVQP